MGTGQSILVTGGAGFIGSNFVRGWLAHESTVVVNLDKLTYAGSLASLADLQRDSRHSFVQGDIGDFELVSALLREHRPWAIVNFAAESHVDRSIHGPEDFVQTNVVGSFRLLEAARGYWQSLAGPAKDAFRFAHVSTDEVYGSLAPAEPAFSESTPYAPNSPYSASKAAFDHFVRAYFHTYGLPTLTTHCSNNYGPYQFPEKLIPLMILNGLEGKPLPVYGDGSNVRDWLHVGDHCDAIRMVLQAGRPGETYNIGGECERTNIDVVRAVCALLDQMRPRSDRESHSQQITFITDRPGHDRRYAMDTRKIESQLGWRPRETFDSGLRKTVEWYLANGPWVAQVRSGDYKRWLELNYGARK
ncbi:MAG: dTDP-glucose 4,6-dehydratase [Burkholderiales bacterium]